MSILQMCYEYRVRYYKEYGHPPAQVRMYKSELDMLKDETRWEMMHPVEVPSPNSVYGMEIIVLESDL